MDDKLERVIIDMYKKLVECRREQEAELRETEARLDALECMLNDIGLRFDTDTIVVER